MSGGNPVRIGILGAGTVATYALMKPVERNPGHLEIVSVAARDADRAAAYAAKYGIPGSSTYEAMLDDPDIDAVYIATPNALHCEWSLKAIDAGKAVLCEKPLGSNADEAERMAEAGGLLVEALHTRYHPQTARMRSMLEEGVLGNVREISCTFLVPRRYFQPDDIRFQAELSGGATMDVGYYATSFMRIAGLAEPEVVRAAAVEVAPGVDGAMKAELRFPNGAVGRMNLSLIDDADDFTIAGEIIGERGRIGIVNPVHPQHGRGLELDIAGETKVIPPEAMPTYDWQTIDFAANVREGTPVLATAEDAVRNMRVIDDIYRAAGMRPRGL
jgi:predicted dehydrogenase